MKIQNKNNFSFKGTLVTKNLGKDSVHFETIAKKVKEETAKFPNVELRLYPNMIQYVDTEKQKDGCHAFFKRNSINKILNNPEYQIVNAFVKFFNIGHNIFNILEEAEKFAKNCEMLYIKINDNSTTNQFDAVYNSALNLVSRYAKSETKNDKILKNWEIHP